METCELSGCPVWPRHHDYPPRVLLAVCIDVGRLAPSCCIVVLFSAQVLDLYPDSGMIRVQVSESTFLGHRCMNKCSFLSGTPLIPDTCTESRIASLPKKALDVFGHIGSSWNGPRDASSDVIREP